jgi:hypothetical protein
MYLQVGRAFEPTALAQSRRDVAVDEGVGDSHSCTSPCGSEQELLTPARRELQIYAAPYFVTNRPWPLFAAAFPVSTSAGGVFRTREVLRREAKSDGGT